MRKMLLATAAAATLVIGVSLPAHAATTGDTTTTFTLTGGLLNLTAPASAALGSGAAGGTLSASLGSVQVVDDRAALAAAWTTTVSSTNFTTGAASAAETIAKANVTYWSGAATATTGTATFVPGQATALNAAALGAAVTAFTVTLGTGSNSATWAPTLGINVPATAVAGAYTGTVTHSVA